MGVGGVVLLSVGPGVGVCVVRSGCCRGLACVLVGAWVWCGRCVGVGVGVGVDVGMAEACGFCKGPWADLLLAPVNVPRNCQIWRSNGECGRDIAILGNSVAAYSDPVA